VHFWSMKIFPLGACRRHSAP